MSNSSDRRAYTFLDRPNTSAELFRGTHMNHIVSNCGWLAGLASVSLLCACSSNMQTSSAISTRTSTASTPARQSPTVALNVEASASTTCSRSAKTHAPSTESKNLTRGMTFDQAQAALGARDAKWSPNDSADALEGAMLTVLSTSEPETIFWIYDCTDRMIVAAFADGRLQGTMAYSPDGYTSLSQPTNTRDTFIVPARRTSAPFATAARIDTFLKNVDKKSFTLGC
jgi:hypothetical protein